MAAKAVAFAEALEFGKEYAAQTIKNAKVLASTLNDLGLKILGEKKRLHTITPSCCKRARLW